MRTGPHQTRSGHVPVPDPRLVLFKVRVCSVLGPWDPYRWPGPHSGGVRIPFQGSGLHTWRSGTNPGDLDCISGGPALSRGGPDSLLMLWSMPPSLDTWRLRTRPRGGVGHCCGPRIAAWDWGEPWLGPTHSTSTTRLRDSRAGSSSLYSGRGYPSFRVPREAYLKRTFRLGVLGLKKSWDGWLTGKSS
jgi:hypothetical protein